MLNPITVYSDLTENKGMICLSVVENLTYVFKFSVNSACAWNNFENLLEYGKKDTIYKKPGQLSNEYVYGNCTGKINFKKLYAQRHLSYKSIKGKSIIRGWLNMHHTATCIILRGAANEEDTFRAPIFNFQICVVRLTFIQRRRAWRYFYFEWYIPNNLPKYMNWDLYFYGPHKKDWGYTSG